MNQALVRLAVTLTGLASALWVGRQVGEGAHLLVVMLILASGLLLFCVWRGLRVEAVVSALLVFGYLLGNRGFAQLSFIPGLPLFPGELGLVLGLAMVGLRTILGRADHASALFPMDREGVVLAGLIMVWIGASGLHLLVDFPVWGIMALRDYALVYYALFFFIGVSLAAENRSRVFFMKALMAGLVCLALFYPFYLRYEAFLLQHLSFQGIPLIYFKGDLAGIFGGAGAVLFYGYFRMRGKAWYLVASLLCLALVPITMSRAAMLGLVVAAVFFWRARERGWLVLLGSSALAGVTLMLTIHTTVDKPLRESRLYDFYEHVVSLADPTGTGDYRGESSRTAGDNNRFRLVWWRTVTEETLREAPFLGMGFGYNLANPFVREYYPGMSVVEFPARSPHNYLITLLGRTGLLGVVLFLGVLVLLGRQSWAEARTVAGSGLSEKFLLQVMLWVIFTGALFGVVLEGPMAAVPFWLLLGITQNREEERDAR